MTNFSLWCVSQMAFSLTLCIVQPPTVYRQITHTQHSFERASGNIVLPIFVKMCGPYLLACFPIADDFSFDIVVLLL
jgi:hypothetical protein